MIDSYGAATWIWSILGDPIRSAPSGTEIQKRFPGFTLFVEGIVFFGFHSGVVHNERVGTNAQADYEQLCYLNWADVFGSNDEGFRSAFRCPAEALGKRLLICENSLASLHACPELPTRPVDRLMAPATTLFAKAAYASGTSPCMRGLAL